MASLTITYTKNGQFSLDNSPSDISSYPARLGLELGVGLVGLRLGSVGLGLVGLVVGLRLELWLGLWFRLVGNVWEGKCASLTYS